MLDMARGGGSESTFGMSLMELLQYTVASKAKLRAAKGEAELMKGKASIMGAQAEMAKAAAAQTQAEAAMKNADKLSPQTEHALLTGSDRNQQGAGQQRNIPPPLPSNQSGQDHQARGNVFGGNQSQGSGSGTQTPGSGVQTLGSDRFNIYATQGGVPYITNIAGNQPPNSTMLNPTDNPLSTKEAGQVLANLRHMRAEAEGMNASASAGESASGAGASTAKTEPKEQPKEEPKEQHNPNPVLLASNPDETKKKKEENVA